METAVHSVKMAAVDAELLEAVGYEDLTHTLYVKFRDGATLRFQKVPHFRFSGLMSAPRKDAYYKTFIKDLFLSRSV
jgi:hypothetical protein